MTYLGYNSKHIDATVTANSADSFYPVSNLQDNQSIKEYRTASGTDVAYVVIDLGSAQSIDAIFVAGNMVERTLAATSLTLEAHTSDSWGSPSFTTTFTDIQNGLAYDKFASQSYRYWRLTLDNTGASYAGCGAIFLGTVISQPISFGWSIGTSSNTQVIRGLFGQIYANERNYKKYLNLPFNTLNKSEMEAILTMIKTIQISKPIWVVADETETAVSEFEQASGQYRLSMLPTPVNSNFGLWDLALSLEELI